MIHEFKESNDFPVNITFQEFLKKKRRLLGLNQTDFGKYIGGRNPHTISFWETGEYSPSFDEVVRIVEMLGGRVRIENVEDIYLPLGFNPWQE